jgi:cobalt-zinc-cadmium efflux system outer membrane protein
MSCRVVFAAVFAACLIPRGAIAQEPLTLEAAVARARSRSAAVRVAEGRAEEARLRLAHLPWLRDNPVAEAALGRREQPAPNDIELGVSQMLELGGGRSARRAEAEAVLVQAEAALLEEQRGVVRDTAGAYLRALSAADRLRLGRTSVDFAADLRRIAERRHEAGDVAALDVNLAMSAHARARADLHAAEADQAAALGDLRILLDLAASETLALPERLAPSTAGPPELAALLSAARERSDLAVLRGELREAEAMVQAGRAARWPEVAPGIRYERDGGERVLWGGLTVTLPVFDRGKTQALAGDTRGTRLRSAIAAQERAIENEVRAAHRAYELRAQAATELEGALDAADDNEGLARRSYEVGQIGLGELLAIRRETLEVRRAWLDAVREAATARVDLETRAGVIR